LMMTTRGMGCNQKFKRRVDVAAAESRDTTCERPLPCRRSFL
jgi:hypothetical protein